MTEVSTSPLRPKLKCSFEQIEPIFDDCIAEAEKHLSEAGVDAYLEGASLICMMGRGVDPVLNYLEDMPAVAG